MASMWRRAMLYLGLGPDDEYDDYEDYDVLGEYPRALAARAPVRYASAAGVPRVAPEARSAVRTLTPGVGDERRTNGSSGGSNGYDHGADRNRSYLASHAERNGAERNGADRAERPERNGVGRNGTDLGLGDRDGRSERLPTARPRPAVVRPLVPSSAPKPHVVAPTSFLDAQEIADKFKLKNPVILNLQGAHRDLSRRIIDFASGLCYGLDGHMERVANQVYLLTPTDVEVSPEERRRLQERGYEA